MATAVGPLPQPPSPQTPTSPLPTESTNSGTPVQAACLVIPPGDDSLDFASKRAVARANIERQNQQRAELYGKMTAVEKGLISFIKNICYQAYVETTMPFVEKGILKLIKTQAHFEKWYEGLEKEYPVWFRGSGYQILFDRALSSFTMRHENDKFAELTYSEAYFGNFGVFFLLF
jgi:hypothetical protein